MRPIAHAGRFYRVWRLDVADRNAICADRLSRPFHGPVQHPPHTAERLGDCIEASGCELFSVAHRRSITLSKAQTQKDRPCFRGPWSKDRDPPHLGKGPRDPAGDWGNGPWPNGEATSPTDYGPHSQAKGQRPEDLGSRSPKPSQEVRRLRSERPLLRSSLHGPWPRGQGPRPWAHDQFQRSRHRTERTVGRFSATSRSGRRPMDQGVIADCAQLPLLAQTSGLDAL